MAWSTSDRRARLPANWPSLRRDVKRRANGICEWVSNGTRCTRPGTDCDHTHQGDNHALTNLQWLCTEHHWAKTKQENAARNTNNAALKRKPNEQHPGRIK